jgi:hypothetical protein
MVEETVVEEVMEPTQEWIDAAKKKYGKIFSLVIGGDVYVYRTLKRSEFKELQKTMKPEMTPQGPTVTPEQSLELEEKICDLCVIWPEKYSEKDQDAAAPSVLSTAISESSGSQVNAPPQEL